MILRVSESSDDLSGKDDKLACVFCHGALYSVIIEVLHVALNFDSYQ